MSLTRLKYFVKSSYIYQRFFRFERAKKANSGLVFVYNRRIPNTYRLVIEQTKIDIDPNNAFQYWIDETLYFSHFDNVLGNMPPDFKLIVDGSLEDFRFRLEECPNHAFKETEGAFLDVIEEYINRCIYVLEEVRSKEPKNCDAITNTVECYKGLVNRKAGNLYEALQRILFWDSIFWQTGHQLVGLGRMDLILDRFSVEAENDPDRALELIKCFLSALHQHYEYKSATLKGDIGQIVILGGVKDDGRYFSNIYTSLFIKACMELHIPDPKCLLRSSILMPRDLLELSLNSLSTGIGGPVIANDDVIINTLMNLGLSHEKACNYAFSACWEPLSYGDSFGQNNFLNINFCECVNKAMDVSVANGSNEDWESFLARVFSQLDSMINSIIEYSNRKQWEFDPLFSLFTEGCISSGVDISKGGALNNDFGILSVGLSHAVNSLMIIKHLVFEDNQLTLLELNNARKENYSSTEGKKVLDLVDSCPHVFGHDDEEVICFCNRIIRYVNSRLSERKNVFGGRYKFGLSSPSYIDAGKTTEASADGRLKGQPFDTHISARSGDVAFTELLGFSSKLNYEGATANGNVVDIMLNPGMVNSNIQKFIQLFYGALKQGVYEIQVNVCDSKTLIDAKNNPGKHLNLIVRVWGFSAYFNDLPEEYKDLLILRAVESEKRYA